LRSMRSRAMQKSRGFSLIEVLVALAIMGIAIVMLMQLFSNSLRQTKRSADYTLGLIHARSLMDEAYALPSLEDVEGTFDFGDGYTATREVTEVPAALGKKSETPGLGNESFKLYEITVTVKWPPSGSTVLTGTRVIYGEAL